MSRENDTAPALTSPSELRVVRKALLLTQHEMAQVLGISTRTWGGYELGQTPIPRAVGLACIALALYRAPHSLLCRMILRDVGWPLPADQDSHEI